MVYKADGRMLKSDIRTMIANACTKTKRTAIMLPAGGAHDVALFLQEGVINRRTKLFAVERDPDVAAEMWVSLFNLGMGPKTTKHVGEIETLKLKDAKIDLAYIDLCGPGTEAQIDWIGEQLLPRLTDDADVFVTLKTNNRGAGFFAENDLGIRSMAEFKRELGIARSLVTTKVTLDGERFGKPTTEPTAIAVAKHRTLFGQIFGGGFEIRSVAYADLDKNTRKLQGSREMHVLHLTRPKILAWK